MSATSSALGSRENPLPVSGLNRDADQVVREAFGSIWVAGEIGRFTDHASGHWYFSLKDEEAAVSAVMFRSRNRAVSFRPEEGLAVLARVLPSVYLPRGQFQVVVESLEPRGKGSVQLAFEQLRERLAAEGLFDEDRKRDLPAFPVRAGLVTSPTGAAVRDVLQVLRRRFAGLAVLLYPARVQGEGAAEELVAGLLELDRRGLDLILLVRGGGAYEDLAVFNDEGLARTLASLETPVVTGIGHETDLTIADLVADLRAPTPSAAAELVSTSREELLERLSSLDRRLASSARHRLAGARLGLLRSRDALQRFPQRLQILAQRLDEGARLLRGSMTARLERQASRLRTLRTLLSPAHHLARIGRRRLLLAGLDRRLSTAVRGRIEERRSRLAALAGRLEALSPLAVLSRGYALVTRETLEGPLVRDAARVAPGDRLAIRLARGSLEARALTASPSPPPRPVETDHG